MDKSVEAATDNTETKRTECEVCQMLMKEKHKNDYIWKILCVCFLAIAIILAILYFSSGAMITETNIELGDDSYVGNNIENRGGNVDVSGDVVIGDNIEGTTTNTDHTPIICISIVLSAAIVIIGGIIIANHNKKDN